MPLFGFLWRGAQLCVLCFICLPAQSAFNSHVEWLPLLSETHIRSKRRGGVEGGAGDSTSAIVADMTRRSFSCKYRPEWWLHGWRVDANAERVKSWGEMKQTCLYITHIDVGIYTQSESVSDVTYWGCTNRAIRLPSGSFKLLGPFASQSKAFLIVMKREYASTFHSLPLHS